MTAVKRFRAVPPRRAVTPSSLWVLLITSAIGCANDSPQPFESTHPAASVATVRYTESNAPLVLHTVAPKETDPAITQFLDNNYVWLDTSARSRHRLFVFMSGTGQFPSQFLFLEKEAARLGYHVIGLEYVNTGGIAKICPPTPDPAACYENVRLEVLDGIDRTPLITVSPANSIDNRIVKLIQFLADNYPDEGWSQYLDDDGPKWPLIAVGGLSVGGGEAAMIAKLRMVDRVVLFSAVPDSIGKQSVPWIANHKTPSNRYYGLAHNRDGFFLPILAGWDSLGLSAFGPPVVVDGGEPPYGYTHMLVTGRTPVGGFVGLNAHGSTATDSFTPLGADGLPLLLDAWRYMLSESPGHPHSP